MSGCVNGWTEIYSLRRGALEEVQGGCAGVAGSEGILDPSDMATWRLEHAAEYTGPKRGKHEQQRGPFQGLGKNKSQDVTVLSSAPLTSSSLYTDFTGRLQHRAACHGSQTSCMSKISVFFP